MYAGGVPAAFGVTKSPGGGGVRRRRTSLEWSMMNYHSLFSCDLVCSFQLNVPFLVFYFDFEALL